MFWMKLVIAIIRSFGHLNKKLFLPFFPLCVSQVQFSITLINNALSHYCICNEMVKCLLKNIISLQIKIKCHLKTYVCQFTLQSSVASLLWCLNKYFTVFMMEPRRGTGDVTQRLVYLRWCGNSALRNIMESRRSLEYKQVYLYKMY